jgi:hypothetical protein
MEKTRVLPPLVRLPSTSDRCCELAESFLVSVAHQLQRGCRSTITDREIEEYVEVSAIAFSWYLATLHDAIKRDELIEELSNYTSAVVVAVEAAGIAMERGVTFDLALHIIGERQRARATASSAKKGTQKSAKRALAGKRSKTSSASSRKGRELMKRGLRDMPSCPVGSRNPKQRPADISTRDVGDRTTATVQDEPQPRRVPQLVMPPYTLKRLCQLVAHALKTSDPETAPGQILTISDEDIAERARACHLAMCWFLGALCEDPAACDPVECHWEKEVPKLVDATIAVSIAEQKGITVPEAIKEIRREAIGYEMQIAGKTCFWWVDAEGNARISGPKEVQDVMNEWIRARDFLRSASHAIGQDVNLLSPGDLDGILSKHHTELAQLVADGGECDVSKEALEEFIERFGEVGEFVQEAINQLGDDAKLSLEMFRHFDNSEILDKIAEAERRSFLIRRHMMEAKIEDRERRKRCLH